MELLPATRLAPSAPKPCAPGTGRAPHPAPGAGGRCMGGGKAAIAALLASRFRRRELRSTRRAAQPAAAPFEICEVPGKGLGAVASRDVKVGELVAEERPPITYVEKSGWVEDMEKQFAALPADTQNALMALHDTEEEKSLKGIFNTNSIGCYSSALDGVLCVVISRFNHSCLPNCEQSWDDDLFRQRLFACKDIKKGEELCFSYVEPFLSFAERSEILEKRYVFRCDCPACTRSGEALRQSDARRRRLGQLVSQLSQGASADAEGGVALAEAIWLFGHVHCVMAIGVQIHCDQDGLSYFAPMRVVQPDVLLALQGRHTPAGRIFVAFQADGPGAFEALHVARARAVRLAAPSGAAAPSAAADGDDAADGAAGGDVRREMARALAASDATALGRVLYHCLEAHGESDESAKAVLLDLAGRYTGQRALPPRSSLVKCREES
ncbi:unnamed protein product [Effrenium voratum]|uniref:SET domain-containing protein n=1 Tax=Effrenium voratum TaxID=2562239 RepID=A0AA36JPQ4_9DINO|nr:unnamed protein product [Effrenium voratum]